MTLEIASSAPFSCEKQQCESEEEKNGKPVPLSQAAQYKSDMKILIPIYL
jgi:hypothetical protein